MPSSVIQHHGRIPLILRRGAGVRVPPVALEYSHLEASSWGYKTVSKLRVSNVSKVRKAVIANRANERPVWGSLSIMSIMRFSFKNLGKIQFS